MNLHAVATEILDDAGGDIQSALVRLMDAGRKDRELYGSIVDPLYRTACYEILCRLIRERRAVIWTAPNYAASTNQERARNSGNHLLMNFPLIGGKLLRDGTKEDVQTSAEFYREQSDDMREKHSWLAAIAKRLPAGKSVGQAFTEEQLHAMKEKIHA